MDIRFKTTELFEKEIKRLKKKYKSIAEDVKKIALQLKENPEPQDRSMGHNFYKIRVPIKSKKTGSRGGGRLIIYVKTVIRGEKKDVYFASIYDKAEKKDLTPKEFDDLRKRFGL